MGAALLGAYPSRRAIGGVLLFGLLTIAFWPWWVSSWLAATATSHTHTLPVMRWGGPLVLPALLKWRRPEARLLVAPACIPQTPNLYEAVPLFLLVTTWAEGAGLSALCAVVYCWAQRGNAADTDLPRYLLNVQQWMVCALYVPCTLIVLRRPNEGALPGPIEWLSRRPSCTKPQAILVGDV